MISYFLYFRNLNHRFNLPVAVRFSYGATIDGTITSSRLLGLGSRLGSGLGWLWLGSGLGLVTVWVSVRVRFTFMVTYPHVVISLYQFSACLLSDRRSDTNTIHSLKRPVFIASCTIRTRTTRRRDRQYLFDFRFRL